MTFVQAHGAIINALCPAWGDAFHGELTQQRHEVFFDNQP